MKFLNLLALATVAVAAPTASPEFSPEEVRHITARAVGTTAKEFTNGGCRDIILLYARGTNQAGNFGEQPGPQFADALKARYGEARVAAEGITYPASLLGNLNSGGADTAGVTELKRLLGVVTTQCPNSSIVVSGYSQGAALVHRGVEGQSTAIKAKIGAAVTFGDTKKQQDGGRIPNFDTSKTLIICNSGDAVCEGTLNITPAHLSYTSRVAEAVTFVASKIK